MRDVVDDVVVVDTGSIDRTKSIAAALGARVFDFEWIGDFAAARNAALERVVTPWTLYIDADEVISTPGSRPVSTWLNATRDAGGNVRFRPRPDYTFYKEPRLFRTDPAIRFSGRIHETHVFDLANYAESRGLRLADTPVTIEHFGYEGDQMHKVARNLPLLQAELARDPCRPYCWHHLAETLATAGRREEAKAACRDGLVACQGAFSEKGAVDRREIAKTLLRLLIEDGEDTNDLADRLVGDAPDDWALSYLRARALLLSGEHDDALAIGERLRAVDPDLLADGLIAFDKRLFADYAWELIGMAHHRAGRRRDAADAFRQASRLAPDVIGYRAKAIALGCRQLAPAP